MVRSLPAVAAAAAVNHHIDFARRGVALHLDEVVAAAHGAELAHHARVGLVDLREIRSLSDGDEEPLALIGGDADRFAAETENLVACIL